MENNDFKHHETEIIGAFAKEGGLHIATIMDPKEARALEGNPNNR